MHNRAAPDSLPLCTQDVMTLPIDVTQLRRHYITQLLCAVPFFGKLKQTQLEAIAVMMDLEQFTTGVCVS